MGLKERKQELVKQLNSLPLAKVTLAVKETSKNLEEEINEVENAIGMFKNRKQVYLGDGNAF
jgi:lipid II:glycine glycyltransferase (peptidoglycan interpeptide bridge formation enzyme)